MKLKKFTVKNFRSIENIVIDFPDNKPVVLFGPNNVGKSNILKALDCLLGEKHPSYIDFQDSDYFLREPNNYPQISFNAEFDEKMNDINILCFTTNHEHTPYKATQPIKENTYHKTDGAKVYLKNEEKEKCHFVLVDANRDISRQLSYFSQYSILSKLSKKMHNELVKEQKDTLDEHYTNIIQLFHKVPKFQQFFDNLQNSFDDNVNGFEHKLEIDLSAYDPNNYFHALKIIASEDKDKRAFDEFGTGEQQILLLSFIKAYAETFKGENFILGIEEPEAHLHPLAQRWLAKNINNIAKSGVQIVITTHSPEFLDIDNVEGFVKVFKENKITKVIQNNAEKITLACLELGANPDKTKVATIIPFYKANTFYDHLKGFFAKKIILVEGYTEFFSLPNYFQHCGYNLIQNGVEIIDCKGKDQISRNYRLFSAYNYECFCLFDADAKDDNKKRANRELSQIFGFDVENMINDSSAFTSDIDKKFGYFGKDFEAYMKCSFNDYQDKENLIEGTKPLKAKIISEENINYQPGFIEIIAQSLKLSK